MQWRHRSPHPSEETLAEALQQAIRAALPDSHADIELTRYYRLMREHGHRRSESLRGRLLLRSASAHGGAWTDALPAAAALELLGGWSSIHSDIENGSEERCGEAALHRELGMPVALNVGDGLHMYMWQLLLQARGPQSNSILSEFTRLLHRMLEGQHLSLAWKEQGRFDGSEAEYLAMGTLKTALYVVGPLRLGALCADRDLSPALEQAGIDLGLAIQINDEVSSLRPGVRRCEMFVSDVPEASWTLAVTHLLAHANADDRAEATDHLTRLRDQPSREDLERLLALIDGYGSLAHAQRVAEVRTRRGLDALQEAIEVLPDQAAGTELARLLASCTS